MSLFCFSLNLFPHYKHTIVMTAPSAPKKITWIIGLTLGILGIIGHYARVQILTEYNYALLLSGFIVLALATTFKEL
jgi:hypothetical protein